MGSTFARYSVPCRWPKYRSHAGRGSPVKRACVAMPLVLALLSTLRAALKARTDFVLENLALRQQLALLPPPLQATSGGSPRPRLLDVALAVVGTVARSAGRDVDDDLAADAVFHGCLRRWPPCARCAIRAVCRLSQGGRPCCRDRSPSASSCRLPSAPPRPSPREPRRRRSAPTPFPSGRASAWMPRRKSRRLSRRKRARTNGSWRSRS